MLPVSSSARMDDDIDVLMMVYGCMEESELEKVR